jgi:gas vesicle protein
VDVTNYKPNLKTKIMNSNAKSLLGIMAAGAVGVAIGMLLAPEKGKDLRGTLKDSIEGLGDKVNDLLGMGKEKMDEVSDEVKNQAKGFKKDATERFGNVKETLS